MSFSYREEIEKRNAAAEEAVKEQANRAAWNEICNHWDVADHEANYTMVRKWCDGEITVSRFEALLETHPPNATPDFTLDWKGTRDKLLAQIFDLLDPNGTYVSAADINALYTRRANGESVNIDPVLIGKSRNIDTLMTKMKFWPKAQLRAKLAELLYKRQTQSKTIAEVKSDLAEHRKAEHSSNPYHPYEKMPGDITSQTIRSATVQMLKFWNQRYGREQVSARLNNNPAPIF